MSCKYCEGATELARREYRVAGEKLYHVGAWCAACKRFTLPWVKQTWEHGHLPIRTPGEMPVETVVELLNQELFGQTDEDGEWVLPRDEAFEEQPQDDVVPLAELLNPVLLRRA